MNGNTCPKRYVPQQSVYKGRSVWRRRNVETVCFDLVSTWRWQGEFAICLLQFVPIDRMDEGSLKEQWNESMARGVEMGRGKALKRSSGRKTECSDVEGPGRASAWPE